MKCAIESIFVTSWSEYLKQSKRNATNLCLHKLTTNFLTSSSTEAAQMEINIETSVDHQYLSNLIKEATTKEKKSFKKELASLRDQIKALKVSSSSTPKKKAGKQ
eukprot:8259257-Ditylum_brightwellii.AAC.1